MAESRPSRRPHQDRHGKGDADKKLILGWVGNASDDANDMPCDFNNGPPELPGLTAASNWINAMDHDVAIGHSNTRSKPEITPELIEPYKPNGFPTTKASSPTRIAFGLPNTAGTTKSGVSYACITAISISGCSTMIASDSVPSANVTLIVLAPVHDMQTGQDVPKAIDDNAASQAEI